MGVVRACVTPLASGNRTSWNRRSSPSLFERWIGSGSRMSGRQEKSQALAKIGAHLRSWSTERRRSFRFPIFRACLSPSVRNSTASGEKGRSAPEITCRLR
jgi:hypothetical protein